MIKITKIANTYEAVHEPTKLHTYDLNRDMACFKLGQLVEKQMTFEFHKEPIICEYCQHDAQSITKGLI